ncbi:MAG: hypothetical protein IKE55_02970 [Kiritimatiellae bacterium]|nr:hypothetical protein [Kiritimatiellia bacterium]
MDTISPEQRSKVMSAIHSRDTLPEICVRNKSRGDTPVTVRFLAANAAVLTR